MNQQAMGMYLHIPFCKSKCPYCDFCSMPRPDAELVETYVNELVRRMSAWGERCRGRAVDTVYLGGGTPTLLTAPQAERIMRAIHDCFSVDSGAEVTVECNPATADREALAHWRELGVNRLSMGAQSAQRDELKALGRLHTWDDVCRTVEDARTVGIDNVNVDFMMGVPHQTLDTLADTLHRAIALDPDHLSAYCLILEEGTPYARRGADALGLPDEDTVADMYDAASAIIREAGYEHYEISNYAKPGRRSRHNLHTWQAREYLGLGVAAHSYLNGERFGNSRDLSAFLRGEDITCERYALTPRERADEAMMLGLRLREGIDEKAFFDRFGIDLWERYGERCAPYLKQGMLIRESGRVRLCERGWMVSNTILADLLP
jgi:oxygen-independent coproporphyrinogen-3 oxidase